MISAGEKLSGMIVADATGEDVDPVLMESGVLPSPKSGDRVVGVIDPASLSMILDLILSFIMKLIDKLREGGLCVRQTVITDDETGEERVVIQAMSEKEKADRVIEELRSPRRRVRARVYVDLQNDLSGTVADPWDHMVSTFKVAGDKDNEALVREAIHEGEAPDYGWA